MTGPVANWNFPTAVRFGAGRAAELGEVCSERGFRRPLIVTDRSLSDLPPVATVRAAIGGSVDRSAVFDAVDPNPTGATIAAGVSAFRDGDHDGVVAVGGGSALDAGKLIAFMSGQGRPIWDFEDLGDNWKRAEPGAAAPVVAVPTTAGTGSEVGRAGVVVDEAERRKVIVFHPDVLPVEVVADPELTVAMPAPVTVGTGMDALSHCLEAYFATGFHPLADGIAIEGTRLALENLPRVVSAPGDLEARGAMMAAALMGATAFQKGLGAMHALSHPIGAMFATHHGMTNAVLMPYVLEANREWISERAHRLANAVGLEGGLDGLIEAIVNLRARIGVPNTLADLGVPAGDPGEIVSAAVLDPSAPGNPRPFDAQLAQQILEAAW